MKLKTLITVSVVALGIFGSKALAAVAGREDNSSMVVWIFLGFCALIVVAQLLPLLLQLRIFASTHKEETRENLETLETSTVKVDSNK
jgi:uncharacterized membrane protein YuzA (DUF378 family)